MKKYLGRPPLNGGIGKIGDRKCVPSWGSLKLLREAREGFSLQLLQRPSHSIFLHLPNLSLQFHLLIVA